MNATVPAEDVPRPTNHHRVSEDEARRRTAEIGECLERLGRDVDEVVALLETAHFQEVHRVLGYRTFAQYVTDEFGGQLRGINRDSRHEIGPRLRALGLGMRPLGRILGVDPATVSRDLRAAGVARATAGVTIGQDGKRYSRRQRTPSRSPAAGAAPVIEPSFGTAYQAAVAAAATAAEQVMELHRSPEFLRHRSQLMQYGEALRAASVALYEAADDLRATNTQPDPPVTGNPSSEQPHSAD